MGVSAKRSSMTFYSGSVCQYSHRVRIALEEKGISVNILEVDANNIPEDLVTLNPYNTLPVLIDRDLVLYNDPNIMIEYLDERFPYPPLLPPYPINKSQTRLYAHRVQKDWCDLVDIILSVNTQEKEREKTRKTLKSSLIAASPLFEKKLFFMSDEFSLIDCCIAPILWRLPLLNIQLKEKSASGLLSYMNTLFERPSFKQSLSQLEKDMYQK